MSQFKKFCIFSLVGVLVASFYPIFMGLKVIDDMVRNGVVLAENYPKYIIPYTPISLAVIIAVLLLPVLMRYTKKYALATATLISLLVFFVSELLLENMVIITDNVTTTLESWQMFMCYVPPESVRTRTWKPVDVLIGDYSPAFKIHFYAISVVLIITLVNCFYGFAKIIVTKDKRRLKALIFQALLTVLFLGLCIFACFTAFFRDGEITVSAVSAILMSLFFVVFGLTSGVYAGSFLVGKKKTLAVLLPSIVASAVTIVMYIGEMVLLSGHLYRFGTGFLFEEFPGIVLAPVDILVIVASGCINAVICHAFGESGKRIKN
ncbi:MAG TPA: hypothetical protein DEF39_01250 [Hungateiclostridium thermocellum]|uniref:Uncharacterized protein n=1 Tax=Acetivibrio thermocellus (strain ATCC 27405 / DSM 1237 / JCM 9322 / NBRC 103400 / NCIMB 10682 / NRRL B-4536 / VPI 7372) TaxID=203119 RepID=A3DCD8_ACET2|nr:hypothetical protein [Acetivibrio thermocellus]CDG35076.1 hypothetical protein CTHBC1_0408 [Acetivibrio thermocellus BC1]ABN51617.1 hypothetical protein Cthe_0379 [Acetivibrio thermocellus ATCC 27405]THJ77386.1 hypothetical protein EPD62_11470 [Acetivibrio thermocellus]UWV45855.1 hypothetical protein N1236_09710 [Acetivibrio thermocellus]HBW25907.1 hypothetical protein [Acetivibrio thermocellus]